MILLKRMIEEINILVIIDQKLYLNNIKVFNSIFVSYEKIYNIKFENFKKHTIIICENNDTIYDYDYIVKCNVNDIHWISFLLCDLDEIYIKIMNCTVFHGAGIKCNNKNILVLGERRTGKTSLIKHILNDHNCFYLDDDCIYLKNNIYYGFSSPLPMRDKALCENSEILEEILDGEGEVRTLLLIHNYINYFQNIDIIIFPKFISEKILIPKMLKLEGNDYFNKLISNIRHSSSIKELYVDLTKLVKSTQGYYLEYNTSDEAYTEIKKILINKT